jgi:hypothetical protein
MLQAAVEEVVAVEAWTFRRCSFRKSLRQRQRT